MTTLGLLITNELKKPSMNAISSSRANYHTLKKYQKCYKLLGIHKEDNELQNASKLGTVGHSEGAIDAYDLDFSDIAGILKNVVSNDQTRREQRENTKNPFQLKRRQARKARATQAAENVVKHRISKMSKSEGVPEDFFFPTNKQYGMERTVEESIQESISKGEFKNLPGFGKPLKDNNVENPYIDFVTHRLNEVLIDNGCTPKWISYQKEIREDGEYLKDKLSKVRAKLEPTPLNQKESEKWEQAKVDCQKLTEDINKKILSFNLLVPILEKQMLQFDLDKTANKILLNGASTPKVVEINPVKRQRSDIMKLIDVITEKLF